MSYGRLVTSEAEKKVTEIFERFREEEGTINFYYGKVRNGKTYAATADILGLLRRGEVVIANWNVNFQGFDERTSFWHLFFKTVAGKRYFYNFKPGNFYYFPPDADRVPLINKLRKEVAVHIFIDEGQWILNSHDKTRDDNAQKLVLTNGHYCRSLNIISQRPQNVKLDYRSQVNFWYKCEKKLSWPWVIFQKTIIEDVKADQVPDEEHESNTRQVYFASRSVFNAYNTHGFREHDATYRQRDMDVYSLNFAAKIRAMLMALWPARRGRARLSGTADTSR